jgi:hypothetical protein
LIWQQRFGSEIEEDMIVSEEDARHTAQPTRAHKGCSKLSSTIHFLKRPGRGPMRNLYSPHRFSGDLVCQMKDTSSTLKKEIEAAMSRTAFLDLFMTE